MTDTEFHADLGQMVAARGMATADFSVAAFTEACDRGVDRFRSDTGVRTAFVPQCQRQHAHRGVRFRRRWADAGPFRRRV